MALRHGFLVLASGLALACGGLEPPDMDALQQISADACEFGADKLPRDCAAELVRRSDECGQFDMTCGTRVMAFAVHCADASDSRDFCQALPDSVSARAVWASSQCAEAGHGSNGTCAQGMVALANGACPLEPTEPLCAEVEGFSIEFDVRDVASD